MIKIVRLVKSFIIYVQGREKAIKLMQTIVFGKLETLVQDYFVLTTVTLIKSVVNITELRQIERSLPLY